MQAQAHTTDPVIRETTSKAKPTPAATSVRTSTISPGRFPSPDLTGREGR